VSARNAIAKADPTESWRINPMTRFVATIGAIALLATTGSAMAQAPASHVGDIPQTLRLDHEETIRHLSAMAKRKTPVGAIAAKALIVIKDHHAKEEEYILPPLTLLQSLSEGKVSPDMKWAIAMADRVKADREQIYATHVKITELMNELLAAAIKTHDNDAKEFAEGAVADALSDMELQEPTTILIGEFLKSKLQ
jgi:hypothetical protein